MVLLVFPVNNCSSKRHSDALTLVSFATAETCCRNQLSILPEDHDNFIESLSCGEGKMDHSSRMSCELRYAGRNRISGNLRNWGSARSDLFCSRKIRHKLLSFSYFHTQIIVPTIPSVIRSQKKFSHWLLPINVSILNWSISLVPYYCTNMIIHT